jgi:hypothetical protein
MTVKSARNLAVALLAAQRRRAALQHPDTSRFSVGSVRLAYKLAQWHSTGLSAWRMRILIAGCCALSAFFVARV